MASGPTPKRTGGGRQHDPVFDNGENLLVGLQTGAHARRILIFNSGSGTHGLPLLIRLVAPLGWSPFVGHRLRRFLSRFRITGNRSC
jgi:hypothetical protein